MRMSALARVWDRMLSHRRGRSSPDGGQPNRGDEVKRRAYLVVVGLLMVLTATTGAMTGLDTPYWGVVTPFVIAYDIVLLVAIWRRWVSFRAVEALILIPLVGLLLGFLGAWRVAPDLVATRASDILQVMLWAGMSFPLCFLVFGTRRGLQVSIAIYAMFLSLVVPPALSGDIPDTSTESMATFTLSLVFFFAAMITLLWVLASRLEELAVARSEASRFAVQATTDALTGLSNRHHLEDELERQIARARRYPESVSVVLVDVDDLKAVNDRLGHHAGDRVLVELARRLTQSVRDADVVGRWGGDEFLLICPHTDHVAALDLAERCRAHVADTSFAVVGDVRASFGVATLSDRESMRALLRRADRALYVAKRDGRDRVAGGDDPGGTSERRAHVPSGAGNGPPR